MEGIWSIHREKFRDRFQSSVSFSKIKGPNDLAAEANDFATGNERTRDRLTEVSIRKTGHRHHGRNCGSHFGRPHNKSGSRAGQAEFRQAHHMHSLPSPERLRLAKNDTGKWPPVGIVDDERDLTLRGDIREMPKLGIRDQVPAGIRRP